MPMTIYAKSCLFQGAPRMALPPEPARSAGTACHRDSLMGEGTLDQGQDHRSLSIQIRLKALGKASVSLPVNREV